MPLFFILISFLSASSASCKDNPVYCKIIELQPKIDKKQAMTWSNQIHKYAKKYEGDPMLAVAIAMQETSLRNISRKEKVIRFYEKCNAQGCVDSWEVVNGLTDVCMFQFHVNTILTYNINPIMLKKDIEYCIEWHFKLMKKKIQYCKNLDKPWACYHSKTKHLRKKYIKMVERYL